MDRQQPAERWRSGAAEISLDRMVEVVPKLRVRAVNRAAIVASGAYVIYWMIAQRRTRWNFALQHAAWQAERLGKPLLVFEPLRIGHRWANDRLHRFVLDGMQDNAARLAAAGVRYLAWIERAPGEGRGLLAHLAARACLVVTDEYPTYFLPKMIERAGEALPVRLEAVDANGILPLQCSEAAFTRAHDFRRFFQKIAAPHLEALPMADPLAGLALPVLARMPAGLREGWASLSTRELADSNLQAKLPIDHEVGPAPLRGGSLAGERRLIEFLDARLDRYAEGRNHPDDEVASGLSPWLHFGHVGVHELVARVFAREGWDASRLGDAKALRGSRQGFWGLSAGAEGFLDQAVIWRELGHHDCWHRPDHADYDSLPAWSRASLAAHAGDPRRWVYTREQLERAQTHDAIWNAAQRQLVAEGRIHNYLRMLWGKKILEWSASPREAFTTMIELNDRWALDGRDPNSYSGIGWVLGRYDRPWGPERPIYGTVRYMSSDNTRKKLELDGYMARWGAGGQASLAL
ncbi:deoxyribodipyrimidine photolyase [Nannocystaceae bacterium ST9]